MSKILIEKNHNMDELQLQDLIERLGKKLKDKFGGDYQLESNLVHYAYHGADAKISFDKYNEPNCSLADNLHQIYL